MNFSIKYRPLLLKNVKGHEKIIKELKKRSKENDFPQTMMFSGKTGVGKTTLQRIVAKNILCQNKDTEGNSCNQCNICTSIDGEKLSSYFFEYNASNLGIDEMRNIEDLAISRSLSKIQKKVIVIDELQELSSNKRAMKNILKVLERPLKDTYFILGAMDEWKVDKSIKNRSIIYRLFDLDKKVILDYLIEICDKEKIEIKKQEQADILVAISDNSGGSLRNAVSILERIVYSEIWDINDAIKELGIITDDKLNQIINGLLLGNIKILENRFDEDLLRKVNEVLNLMYKVNSGLEVEFYEKDRLKGISKVDNDRIHYTIEKLFELQKYIYLTPVLIEFYLIDIVNHNKGKVRLQETIEIEPRRRRLQNETIPKI